MWQHPNGYYYYSKTSLGTKDKREALKREQELRRVKWLEKHKLINNKVVNNTTLKELMVKVAGIHQTSLLMGHTSFNTTQKYLHISINDYSFSNNNLRRTSGKSISNSRGSIWL